MAAVPGRPIGGATGSFARIGCPSIALCHKILKLPLTRNVPCRYVRIECNVKYVVISAFPFNANTISMEQANTSCLLLPFLRYVESASVGIDFSNSVIVGVPRAEFSAEETVFSNRVLGGLAGCVAHLYIVIACRFQCALWRYVIIIGAALLVLEAVCLLKHDTSRRILTSF